MTTARRVNKPSALRWLIGAELANFRTRANLSMTDVAELAKISKPKIGNLETGDRRQFPADIAKILTVCRAAQHDIDRLTTLASIPDSTTWWGSWSDVVPDWFGTFVGLERLAASEFVFEPLVLPGLMQTPEYAREITLRGSRVRRDHSERVIEVRMERARRLVDEESPLTLHAVVTEQALRLKLGTPELVRAQYEHMCELAERPNVTLQVITPDCGPHDAGKGQFAVLDFDMAQSIAWVELQDGAMYIQRPGEVDTYEATSYSLREVALSQEDSLAFIADLGRRLT